MTFDEQVDELQRRGHVILDDCIPSTAVDEICRELEPWFAQTPRCMGDFYGWQTTRLASILYKSPAAHALLLQPEILRIMDRVLGLHCDWYQLNLSQAIRLHPGEREQIPHRDDDMWPIDKYGVEYMVNVMWALSDFTVENGATRLWPVGAEHEIERSTSTSQAAQMRRGSALVYLGSALHCGGSNGTNLPRTGLIFSYSLGWLKPYENPFLAYPPAVARTFAKPVRDLLGYRIHRPNLGQYEGQDPSVIFDSDSRTLPTVDALPESIAKQLRAHYRADA
jgi:ectoine hydroxylase-related dioxygenase (phytanoyl-CoA dioxygenase family)